MRQDKIKNDILERQNAEQERQQHVLQQLNVGTKVKMYLQWDDYSADGIVEFIGGMLGESRQFGDLIVKQVKLLLVTDALPICLLDTLHLDRCMRVCHMLLRHEHERWLNPLLFLFGMVADSSAKDSLSTAMAASVAVRLFALVCIFFHRIILWCCRRNL